MLDELHNHDGQNSKKIRVSDVIPAFTMTTAEITAYLARPSFEGEEFNVYNTTTSTFLKYIYINGAWKSLGQADLVVFNATASNTLQDSADTAKSVGGNTTQIMKSIRIYGSGTVRVKCDYARNASYSTQGFFSVNGTTVGGSVTDSVYPSYVTVTADLTIAFGDTVEFKIQTFQTNSIGYCKNFRVYYDKSTLTNQIVTD